MKRVFISFLVLGLFAQAQSLQETIDKQAREIKELKRQLAIKKQEIKILLITLKNAQQESMLNASSPSLQFKDIKTPNRATVVLKPSMLSEMAIREIDKYDQSDTDTIQENLREVVEDKPSSDMPVQKVAPVQKQQSLTKKTSPTPVVQAQTEPVVEKPKVLAQKKSKQKPLVKTVEPVQKPHLNLPPLQYTKPTKYRVRHDAKVYAKIGAIDFQTWKARRAFTSNKKRGHWIRITGLITHEGWVKAPSEMWIDEKDVRVIK